MSATNYGRKKMLDDFTGVAPFTWPPLYLSLHTAAPGDTGSLANEVVGGGYARLALAGVMGAADASGFCVNTVAISIGPASVSWGTITWMGVMDAITAGNMAWPGVPSSPRTINVGQSFVIPVGQLTLRFK